MRDTHATLSDIALRLGGDPHACAEFGRLREELNKVNHPARPDVNWADIERLCTALLQRNGVDLQTMACLALARSQRFGVAGTIEGVALMDGVVRLHSARVWPPGNQARLEIFTWLFTQLLGLLRAGNFHAHDLPLLVELDSALGTFHERLDGQLRLPVVALHSLRQLVRSAIKRGQRHMLAASLPPVRDGVSPMRLQQASRLPRFLAVAGALCILGLGAWGSVWVGKRSGDELSSVFPLAADAPAVSAHVATLTIFAAGSAELRPDSTKALIGALARLAAQPGRLIMISGHTDASGDAQVNQRLSLARAAAVRDWLQRMAGIADECVAIQGLAASQPVNADETTSGRTANRRVEIRWVSGPGTCTSVRPDEAASASGV